METIEEELFKKIKGFIVTGSHYDAYDTSMPWVPFSYDIFNKIIYPETENVIYFLVILITISINNSHSLYLNYNFTFN